MPENMDDILANGTQEGVKRITEAFPKMKKLDIAALKKAVLNITLDI